MLILSTTITHESQSMEIFVKYDTEQNIVMEIKSVFISSPLGMISVGNLFINTPELDIAINKIIDRTDWREIYREMQEGKKAA